MADYSVVVSDTFDFNTQGWYYPFENGSSVSASGETNYIAYNYRAYASFWAYSSQAVYGKDISSVVLKITSSSDKYLSGKDLSFCFACAPLANTTSALDSAYNRDEKNNFGAHTATFLLPGGASQSVEVDITDVVKYAAENYNQPWGLYIIGGEFDGEYNDGNVGSVGSNGVTVIDPEFIKLSINEAKIKIHNGSTWVDGIPYVHNGTTWVKAKAIYIHNGSTWVKA